MSASDAEEPMELCTDRSEHEQPPMSDKGAENKEEVQVTISVEWSEAFMQQKYKVELEKILQRWANNDDKFHGDCKVLHFDKDGSALVSFKPAPAQSELQSVLQQLIGKELERDGKKIVKIKSVSSTPREVHTPAPEEASINLPPSSVSVQHDKEVQLPVQHSAVPTAEEEAGSCSVPVNHFWYVNHIYKKEMERIEEENGVQIMAEVNVTFEGDQKDGSSLKARSEFISLVQKCLGDSNGLIIPLKRVNPEEWKDTVNIIQRKENKLLLTVSSEEMTVCGPRQSQDVISKSLTEMTNTSTYVEESTWQSQDKPPNIGMSIKDPLVNAGLTMEERHWKLMTTSFGEQVAEIKAKFNVDFKESFTNQEKVKVKANYNKLEGNVSMESHAVRALLQLYQKIATSPLSFTRQNGAIGVMQSEGASGGGGLGGHSGYNNGAPIGGGATGHSGYNTGAPTGGGATGHSGYNNGAPTGGGATGHCGYNNGAPTGGGATGHSGYNTGAPTGGGATGHCGYNNGAPTGGGATGHSGYNNGAPTGGGATGHSGYNNGAPTGGGATGHSGYNNGAPRGGGATGHSGYNNGAPTGGGATGHSGYNNGAPTGGGATGHSGYNNGAPRGGGATGHSGYNNGAPTGGGATGHSGYNTGAPTGGGATAGDPEEDEKCPICLEKITNKRHLKCKHVFCGECLDQSRKNMGPICPVCRDVFGLMEGDQPGGKMTWTVKFPSLPGFPGCRSITILYDIPSGTQTEKHSNPGKYYNGISRIAYLPDNKEGREVLLLLKKAFDQRLIFTVGTSRTTGMENQVTWNDIHHKTSTTGGPSCFGYPDPGYLSRVKEELKAKGIV